MGKHKKKKDKKEHRSRSKDSKVGKSLKRGHKRSHQHDDKSHKRKAKHLLVSSSSESGSEIDRPSKRRRIHSDTGDSDSMNEANGAKRTGIQTTISGFLSGPGISSAVAAEVNAPSDAEKGRQKGQSSTPSALNLDTVIEVYRFGHTKCH
ncbi:uncharacterized protein [Porites lutea]|uniref:uncharacterized protein n=1 Tax=Porites lutea TaxID=51062 RepID=UPI003CC50967